MTKYFTYFHLNRGLSPKIKARIKQERARGIKPLPLKGTAVSFGGRKVLFHLHEERYQPWFDRIEKILARDGIPVYDLSDDVPVRTTVAVAKEESVEEWVEAGETAGEKAQPPAVEEAPTPSGETFLEERPRRARRAPVFYDLPDGSLLSDFDALLDENPVHVRTDLSVNEIPEALEVRVKRGVEDPGEIRGAVTDRVETVLLGLRYAFPVVYVGTQPLPDGLTEFFTTELQANFLTLPVADADKRKAALQD